MLYRALRGFAGVAISMAQGAVGEIADRTLADDLINAGYIEPIGVEEEEPPKPAKKAAAKKGGKAK